MSDRVKYYHGGPAGLKLGKRILPAAKTGARSTSDMVMANNPHRKDKVYITTDFHAAVMYASGHERGWIYEVEPIGDLEHDPDCTLQGLSYQCDAAVIKRIHKMSYAQTAEVRRMLLVTL